MQDPLGRTFPFAVVLADLRSAHRRTAGRSSSMCRARASNERRSRPPVRGRLLAPRPQAGQFGVELRRLRVRSRLLDRRARWPVFCSRPGPRRVAGRVRAAIAARRPNCTWIQRARELRDRQQLVDPANRCRRLAAVALLAPGDVAPRSPRAGRRRAPAIQFQLAPGHRRVGSPSVIGTPVRPPAHADPQSTAASWPCSSACLRVAR